MINTIDTDVKSYQDIMSLDTRGSIQKSIQLYNKYGHKGVIHIIMIQQTNNSSDTRS